MRHVTEYLDLVERDGARWLACARYGQPLGPGRENYKLHVQFRQFCCPACGGLIENEVCRAQDPVLWDIELACE